ncbi:FAD-binding protein [Salmonella enterica subsp. enterica serovar Java]|uniref:FAD-binding protein n=1 Tax=Salmonella enterica subsp. enterica serovar Java TaxID=224729 RepID=A0A3Y9C4E9_SALEB|nr:FAD-binding protein [Salmonella enterica subsp. enterica serovar Java]ECG3199707.1 FAD-binding protein [Salmonella enterica subsp. enterica serovar Java]EDC4055910.1 FAD-binding protein [Salmonella enterica subsp. enterica serovar Java]HCA3587757.1 FAD-binding protein [Salmonella enterica subsp. enterica serovar Java]
MEKEAGINLINTPVTLAPFAHSCNGGIKINTDSESSVGGLFAVGDISSAIEDANRMGGNSVGASLVYSGRAIMKSLQYKGKNLRKDSSEKESAGLINGKSNLYRSSDFSALREMMTIHADRVHDHCRIDFLQRCHQLGGNSVRSAITFASSSGSHLADIRKALTTQFLVPTVFQDVSASR